MREKCSLKQKTTSFVALRSETRVALPPTDAFTGGGKSERNCRERRSLAGEQRGQPWPPLRTASHIRSDSAFSPLADILAKWMR